ncbi:hypothetical protein HYV86_03905 [Candidatus Woesearchaeota archaeon]|nr:hypothetical protein [Candidatus Woesearchaeota archaeon]
MSLLPPELINKALNLGLLRVNGTRHVNAHSIDVQITDTLWTEQDGAITIPPEGFVLQPDQVYGTILDQAILLKREFIGEITTRSSYARLGTRLDPGPASTDLTIGGDREFTPRCNLDTFGTHVRIYPYEPIGQIFFHTQLEQLLAEDIKAAMDSGDFVIYNGDRQLSKRDVTFQHALKLHMDDVIHVYKKGKILDTRDKDHSQDFETVNLRDHPEGYYLPKGAFFISSSREKFATSNKCVAYVTPTINLRPAMTITQYPDPNHFTLVPFLTHPNAPYHAYGLNNLRQMTFENYVTQLEGVYLHAGCKQAELVLVPFLKPSEQTMGSRYAGQVGATLRRAE